MKTHLDEKPAEPAGEPADATTKKRRRRNERNAALYDDEVFELLQAIDGWRRKSNRSFPAWSEVIQLLKGLGWRKVAPTEPLPVPIAEPPSPIEPRNAA
jgi:hypothetical protein